MAGTGHRWRRLARKGNKLLLNIDGRNLAIQPVLEGYVETVSVIPPTTFVAQLNLPPEERGTERLKSYYGTGIVPQIEVVDVEWSKTYEANSVTYNYPGSRAALRYLSIEIPYKQVYRRDGGVFPLSGRIVEPVVTEKPGVASVSLVLNLATEKWEMTGGIFYDGKVWGGHIHPDHLTFVDEEILTGYDPVDDNDFISATK